MKGLFAVELARGVLLIAVLMCLVGIGLALAQHIGIVAAFAGLGSAIIALYVAGLGFAAYKLRSKRSP